MTHGHVKNYGSAEYVMILKNVSKQAGLAIDFCHAALDLQHEC